MTSHLNRKWPHLGLVFLLTASTILAALPRTSRADRVALTKSKLTTQAGALLTGANLISKPSGTTEARSELREGIRLVDLSSAAGGTGGGGSNIGARLRQSTLSPTITVAAMPGAKAVFGLLNNRPGNSPPRLMGLTEATPKVFSIARPVDLNVPRTQGSSFTKGNENDTASHPVNDAMTVGAVLPDSLDAGGAGSFNHESAKTGDGAIGNEPGRFTPEMKSVSASARTQQTDERAGKTEAKITIKAEKRGSPFISLMDGKELSISAQDANASPATVMASADFDSDRVADLVTADRNGTMRFYRGNSDSMSPNSSQAKKHKAEGTFVDSPFYPSEKSFDVGTAPDFLEVGDFNADGKKDVLALAKGENRLQVMYGDGRGDFSAPVTILLAGKATALAIGEIGAPDGQTDVAVAIQTDKGSQLLVFEHPEGAFKHPPEVIALTGPASDIALGNLDGDFYVDIAVASGNVLTIVHGRGQAYPWDMIKEVGIKRPAAIVARRTMLFSIAGLAIGKFGDQRGSSLAMLSDDGSIHRLEPVKPCDFEFLVACSAQITNVRSDISAYGC